MKPERVSHMRQDLYYILISRGRVNYYMYIQWQKLKKYIIILLFFMNITRYSQVDATFKEDHISISYNFNLNNYR